MAELSDRTIDLVMSRADAEATQTLVIQLNALRVVGSDGVVSYTDLTGAALTDAQRTQAQTLYDAQYNSLINEYTTQTLTQLNAGTAEPEINGQLESRINALNAAHTARLEARTAPPPEALATALEALARARATDALETRTPPASAALRIDGTPPTYTSLTGAPLSAADSAAADAFYQEQLRLQRAVLEGNVNIDSIRAGTNELNAAHNDRMWAVAEHGRGDQPVTPPPVTLESARETAAAARARNLLAHQSQHAAIRIEGTNGAPASYTSLSGAALTGTALTRAEADYDRLLGQSRTACAGMNMTQLQTETRQWNNAFNNRMWAVAEQNGAGQHQETPNFIEMIGNFLGGIGQFFMAIIQAISSMFGGSSGNGEGAAANPRGPQRVTPGGAGPDAYTHTLSLDVAGNVIPRNAQGQLTQQPVTVLRGRLDHGTFIPVSIATDNNGTLSGFQTIPEGPQRVNIPQAQQGSAGVDMTPVANMRAAALQAHIAGNSNLHNQVNNAGLGNSGVGGGTNVAEAQAQVIQSAQGMAAAARSALGM